MRNPARRGFRLIGRGFTLIELLVVIGIILLIAALSIPAINVFLKGKVFNQAAQQVQTAFLRARSRAITERELHYVLIYVKAGSFTLDRPSGGTKVIKGERGALKVIDSNEKQKKTALELSVVETLYLPEQVAFDPSYAPGAKAGFYIQFFYDGSCIIKEKAPQDASSAAYYSGAPNTKTPYLSTFDLIVRKEGDTGTTDRPRLYFDIIQGTGQLKFRLWPK